MANSYEMMFRLGAELSKGFTSTFGTADKTISTTQKTINELYRAQSEISSYEKQQKAIAATERKLSDLQKEYDNIQREIQETEGFDSNLENQLIRKQAQIDKTTESLNNQTQKLDEMGQELREAGVDTEHLTEESDRLEKEMGDLADKNKEAGDSAEEFGNKGESAFGQIGEALIAAGIEQGLQKIMDLMIESTEEAGKYADSINTMSLQYGISAEQLQTFTYAAELVDVDVNTITKSFTKNEKSMYSAAEGSKAASEAYKALGVDIYDSNHHLRDGETVYWEVIDALGSMRNETERDGIAMQLLGKSALELNPLIKAGSESMAQYAAEAEQMGYIMSGPALQAAQKLDDAEQKLKNTKIALKNAIGAQLSPAMTKLKELEAQLLAGVVKFIQNNPKVVKGIAAIVTIGLTLLKAYLAYKAVKIAMIVVEKLHNALKKEQIADTITETGAKVGETVATEGATVAQMALNAAMYACPILAIIGGIGALIGVMGNFADSTDTATDSLDAYSEAAENIDGITLGEPEIAEASDFEKQQQYVGDLVSKLEELNKQPHKNAVAIQGVVDALNEEYEGLGLVFNGSTGDLNYSIEALKTVTSVLKREGSNSETAKLYQAKLKEIAEYKAGIEAIMNDTTPGIVNVEEEQAAIDEFNAKIRVAQGELEALEAQMAEEAVPYAFEETFEMIVDGAQRLKEKYEEVYAAAYSSISGQYKLWDTAAVVTATSVESINTSMETQTAYWSDYNTDLEKLSSQTKKIEGLSDMIATFADGSPESVNMIAGMANATEDELADMVSNWKKLKEQQEKAAKGLADVETNYQSECLNIERDLRNLVDEMDLSEEAKDAAERTMFGFTGALRGHLKEIELWGASVKSIVSDALSAGETLSKTGNLGKHYEYYDTGTTKNGLPVYEARNEYYYKGYASGTDYATAGWHLVGEEGPELLNFHGGEAVINANDTRDAILAGGGGSTITIAPSFVVNGASGDITDQLEQFKDMLIESVVDAMDERGVDAGRMAFV